MCQSFAASETAPLTPSSDKWHHSYTPTRTAHAFTSHPSQEAPSYRARYCPVFFEDGLGGFLWADVWTHRCRIQTMAMFLA